MQSLLYEDIWQHDYEIPVKYKKIVIRIQQTGEKES